jgi:hypothetical protein
MAAWTGISTEFTALMMVPVKNLQRKNPPDEAGRGGPI